MKFLQPSFLIMYPWMSSYPFLMLSIRVLIVVIFSRPSCHNPTSWKGNIGLHVFPAVVLRSKYGICSFLYYKGSELLLIPTIHQCLHQCSKDGALVDINGQFSALVPLYACGHHIIIMTSCYEPSPWRGDKGLFFPPANWVEINVLSSSMRDV